LTTDERNTRPTTTTTTTTRTTRANDDEGEGDNGAYIPEER
jgi:hypothetical protein